MKDPQGHGSVGHSGIRLAPGARFNPPSRPVAKQSTNDQVAGLRARLAQPKPSMAQTFMQSIKNAMGYTS